MADRPRVYKTEGVILRRRNLGEADSIFTVFSPREGKFDAIAKGVRKARSRMRGHLEPLTRSSLLLARGRSLDVFTQAETIAPYRAVRDDLQCGAVAIYCAELVDRFTIERAENFGLYELLLALLDALEGGAPSHVARYFELHVLALTGYELQLDACAVCGGRILAGDVFLSPSAGGFVCTGCRAKAGGGRIISLRAVKVLRYAHSTDIGSMASLRIDEDLGHELEGVMAEVVRHFLEHEPRTRPYLEQVSALASRVSAPHSEGVELPQGS